MPPDGISFQEFANFSNTDTTPILPLENPPDFYNDGIDLHYGAFTTVFEMGNGRVAKVNRLLSTSKDGVRMQSREIEQYLVKKTGNEEQDREEAVNRMMAYARDKRETYNLLREYLGEFIPELEMMVIIESPRQAIEKRFPKQIPQEILNGVPSSEITLMEVWEKVDTRREFSRRNIKGLRRIYKEANCQEELKKLAEASMRLFNEKGVCIDISDSIGLRGFGKDGKRTIVDTCGQLAEVDTGEVVVYPRNVTIDNGHVRFYDAYPAHQVDSLISPELLAEIKDKLKAKDFQGLQQMEETSEKPKEFKRVAHYLYLLQRMGANI